MIHDNLARIRLLPTGVRDVQEHVRDAQEHVHDDREHVRDNLARIRLLPTPIHGVPTLIRADRCTVCCERVNVVLAFRPARRGSVADLNPPSPEGEGFSVD